ncbi:hypothetical protein ANN_23587 [Periplaneta americana]|uniref:Uncharacterized protein n=1 Tax=Periplaneta americana TaxID=6978 RepID=A0ABQ8SLH6_PERAM|nr:hypothetical protein ANN_23587 [Periplaneta americana]
MVGLCEGGNEPEGSLKAICKKSAKVGVVRVSDADLVSKGLGHRDLGLDSSANDNLRAGPRNARLSASDSQIYPPYLEAVSSIRNLRTRHERRHSSIVDIRTFRGADCNSDHYLVIGELRERLSVAKRVEQQVYITKFNILKLKDEETKQNYQVDIWNRFATLESSDEVDKELDVNSVWENIRDSIKIAAEQSIGYYETKKKKQWFDEDCCIVVERRKQAKLKFLQDPVEEKRDTVIISMKDGKQVVRLGIKKRDYLKEKLNEVETNSKNKNIRDLYKGIKEFKNGYQPRVNVIKDENGDLLADSPSILNRWKNYFA